MKSKIVIPDSSFSNNHGLFSTPMTFPEKQNLVVVMSDATGFGSGGASPVITVGAPVHNVNCDTHDNPSASLSSHPSLGSVSDRDLFSDVDFTFTDDDALTQCA